MASVTGDTVENVFEDLRISVRDCLNQKAEQLFKQQEDFETAIWETVRRPSFFERLNDECFGDDSAGPPVF